MPKQHRPAIAHSHRDSGINQLPLFAWLVLALALGPGRTAWAAGESVTRATQGLSGPAQERVKLVEITFVPSHVHPTDGTTLPAESTDEIDGLVTALKAISASASTATAGTTEAAASDSSSAVAVERVKPRVLLLRGGPRQMADMMRALDRIDQPWPQVQMTMWAVQVSGNAQRVDSEIRRISSLIDDSREELIALKRKLVELAKPPGVCLVDNDPKYTLAELAADLHFTFPYDEPMSFNEALILLMARPDREEKLEELGEFAFCQREADQCRDGKPKNGKSPQVIAARAHNFRRLIAALPKATQKVHCERLVTFLRSYHVYQQDDVSYPATVSPIQAAAMLHPANVAEPWEWYQEQRDHAFHLKADSAKVDSLLKTVTDAFVADVEEFYFLQLLAQIRGAEDQHIDGVQLVGRTRLVVTSGLESDLDSQMASYVDTTRPKPFGKDVLDAIFPSSNSVGGAATKVALPQVDLASLAAGVLTEPEPRYSQVAPGIAVHVRPTVLADGSAARLKIDARFGVATADYNPNNQNPSDQWVQPPPPGISAHRVQTDAAVSAFDLFDISSFSVDTVVPRSPFVVPILGRLPFIGHIFEIPRKNQSIRHESIILVNTVILPRALELASFYLGDGPAPDKAAKQGTVATNN